MTKAREDIEAGDAVFIDDKGEAFPIQQPDPLAKTFRSSEAVANVIRSLDTQITIAIGNLVKVNEYIQALTMSVEAHSAAINVLLERVAALEKIAHEPVDFAPYIQRIEALEASLKPVDFAPYIQRIEALEASLKEVKQDIDDAEERIDDLNNELSQEAEIDG